MARKRPIRRPGQQGYALLLVLFLVALVALATTAVTPNILTAGKREKEAEMIWRGKQYVRGVKLFYRKNGRFPTQLDDLTKPKMGSLRFMRQPYKDPMNKEDGSWRLIYVGASGQLIGSLKPNANIQMSAFPQLGTPAAALAGQNANQAGAQPLGAPAGAATFGAASTVGTTPAAGGISGTGASGQPATATPPVSGAQPGQGTDTSAAGDDQAAALTASTPTILGGNIIGVGSKINQRSLKVYEKARNYRLFEFIWDPSKEVAAAVTQPQQPGVGAPGTGFGTPINGPAGTQPMGTQPGNPSPQPNPMPPTQINPPNQ